MRNRFNEFGLTSVCCISNVFPIAGTNEELDLGEERLKVGGVWHGKLHKSDREEEASSEDQQDFWANINIFF